MSTTIVSEVNVGSVRADEVLSLEEFKRRMKWGHRAFRNARRKGLIVRQQGRTRFLLGKDILDFFGDDSAIVND